MPCTLVFGAIFAIDAENGNGWLDKPENNANFQPEVKKIIGKLRIGRKLKNHFSTLKIVKKNSRQHTANQAQTNVKKVLKKVPKTVQKQSQTVQNRQN
jgi:hypothetical protein